MNLDRLLGNIKDEDLVNYQDLKKKLMNGFYLKIPKECISPRDFLKDFISDAKNANENRKDSRNVPFQMKMRNAARKQLYLGGATLSACVEYRIEVGPSIFFVKKEEVLINSSADIDQLFVYYHSDKWYAMDDCRLLLKVVSFDRSYYEDESYFVDESSTEEYVDMLLSPSTLSRVLADYRSSSWLNDRLTIWGVDRVEDIPKRNFGFKTVREVERFVENLANKDISSKKLMDICKIPLNELDKIKYVGIYFTT